MYCGIKKKKKHFFKGSSRWTFRVYSRALKKHQDGSGRLLIFIFFSQILTAELFLQHWLCGGDAADSHGQQARPEETNRCRPTSAAGGRLPRLQLPASGSGCKLMVVSA